jgi:hypothetical protein
LENFQTPLLQELNFIFSVIGITETKIRDNDFFDSLATKRVVNDPDGIYVDFYPYFWIRRDRKV